MKNTRNTFTILFLMLLMTATLSVAGQDQYWELSYSVEKDRLKETIGDMARLGSRVTGYEGSERAGMYIYDSFKESGLDDVVHRSFEIPVPVDRGGTIKSLSDGRVIDIYSVWPNVARTSTCSVEGKIIYGGKGELRELNGQEMKGSVVLLDFNSGMDWLNAFMLGAKAVVFLSPLDTYRKQAEDKFLTTPADLPRFYASSQDREYLLILAERGEIVQLEGRMDWELKSGTMVMGIIEGNDPELRKRAVVIEGYYDSISAVPALAPGADQASGIAGLLELARLLAKTKPKRSVIFLALPGHFECLAGARDFVALLRSDTEGLNIEDQRFLSLLKGYEMDLYVCLDLSSGSDVLSMSKRGWVYRIPWSAHADSPVTERVIAYAEEYEKRVNGGKVMLHNGIKSSRERGNLGKVPSHIAYDGEAINLAGELAITFVTINDSRRLWDTPLDLPQSVNYDNLKEQMKLLVYIVSKVVDDPRASMDRRREDSFGILEGEVASFEKTSYLPDVPVDGAIVRARLRTKAFMGVRGDLFAITDSSGKFEIRGVEHSTIYLKPTRIEAYGVDKQTGDIVYAPDMGIRGYKDYPTDVLMTGKKDRVTVVAFGCKGITLFDMVDQRYLFTLDDIQVLDAKTEADALSFGYCLPLTPREVSLFVYTNNLFSDVEPCAVVFAETDKKIKITMTTGIYGLGRRMVLTNSNPEDPQGVGFDIESTDRITHTSYQAALDAFLLNESRIKKLKRNGIHNPRLEGLHQGVEKLLKESEGYLKDRRYDRFTDSARKAWGYASRAYTDVENTMGDVAHGVLFFLALVLPFSYFCERLLFGSVDIRRKIAGFFLVFVLTFLILRYVHPAFELTLHPVIILEGFVVLALAGIVMYIGFAKFNRQIREAVSPRLAAHRVDLQRYETLLRAFIVGVSNMKRRKLRTALTLSTIVLMTFSVVSFSSIKSSLRVNRRLLSKGSEYEGVLFRMPGWTPLERPVLNILRDRYGPENVAPRAWRIWSQGRSSTVVLERVGSGENHSGRTTFNVSGILGLSAYESRVTHSQKALIWGRWFKEGENDACIVPSSAASKLGIGKDDRENAKFKVWGMEFKVIGVIDENRFDKIEDLNGYP